jgi:gas vesicle protein
MAFDVLSFLAGIAAGGLTGALAMTLHGLEKTADLQEHLRRVTQDVERMGNASSNSTSSDSNQKAKTQELRRELDEIHEEIRRMYKRSTH